MRNAEPVRTRRGGLAAMAVVAVALLCSCAHVGTPAADAGLAQQFALMASEEAVPLPALPADATALAGRLEADLRTLQGLAQELGTQHREMLRLRRLLGVRDRGYYTSDETDRIEWLLSRYLACRDSVCSLARVYGALPRPAPDARSPERAKAFLLGLDAACQVASYTSDLVATCVAEPAARDKINEAHVRYDIPAGAFDRLLLAVTSEGDTQALRAAWDGYATATREPASAVAQVIAAEPAWAEVAADIDRLYARAQLQTDYVLEKTAVLLPEFFNHVRHSVIGGGVRKSGQGLAGNLYQAQGLLYRTVGDVRTPLVYPAVFSASQVADIKGLLRPGDVLLTFTSGYMSNVFLPGRFKHGITYVGSPAQRQAIGLAAATATGVPEARRRKLAEDLAVAQLAPDAPADVIEAVAEGVIFNSLERLLQTHTNRLVVLRPRVTPEERVAQLQTAFLLLGSAYDFHFDFDDTSCQCCTEVIYRGLNGRSGLRLPLTWRAGTQTLSADDLLRYWLETNPQGFEFVLMAEGTGTGLKRPPAALLTGDAGRERVRALMHEAAVLDPARLLAPLTGRGEGKP